MPAAFLKCDQRSCPPCYLLFIPRRSGLQFRSERLGEIRAGKEIYAGLSNTSIPSDMRHFLLLRLVRVSSDVATTTSPTLRVVTHHRSRSDVKNSMKSAVGNGGCLRWVWVSAFRVRLFVYEFGCATLYLLCIYKTSV